MPALNPQNFTCGSGNNKLVRGSSRKTWSSNKPLIARLIFSELIQTSNPALSVLPAVYRSPAGQAGFIAALAIQVDILLASFGLPPAGLVIVKLMVNELGAQNMVDAIEQGSSGFMAPKSNNLYTFKNDVLNIPSGEYAEGSVWRSSGVTYILEQKNQWIGFADWIGFVPNLSWLGEWIEYDCNSNSILNPAAVLPKESLPPGTFTPIEPGSSAPGTTQTTTTGGGITPFVIAAILAKVLLF